MGRLRGPEALGAALLGLVRDGARGPQGVPAGGAAALPALPHPPEAQAAQLLPGAAAAASRGGGAAHAPLPGAREEDGGGGQAGEERGQHAIGLKQEEDQQEKEDPSDQDRGGGEMQLTASRTTTLPVHLLFDMGPVIRLTPEKQVFFLQISFCIWSFNGCFYKLRQHFVHFKGKC